MVGSHTFIGQSPIRNTEQLSFLRHEPWFFIKQVEDSECSSFFISAYEGYPYKVIKNDKWTIVIEGMIYNISEDEISERLGIIAEGFVKSFHDMIPINEFASDCDGDFVVQILDKVNGKYLVFNDYYARLPLYYSTDGENLIISRDIKTNLEFSETIEPDLSALTSFLMLSYVFGNRTYFKNIKRLEPYQAILVNDIKRPSEFKVHNTNIINYNCIRREGNKKELLNKLLQQFLLDTKNRVNKLRGSGYDVICAMSGGFDSRAILGGLTKFDKKIKYITFEYVQDESKEARAAFNELEEPGEYVKLKFDNVIDYSGIEALVFKTNGIVDYLTTSVVYNDLNAKRNYLKNSQRIGHFSGYGGEFLRCPINKIFKSVFWGLNNQLYNMISLDDTVKVFKNSSSIKTETNNYYKKEYNLKRETQLRKFNAEYAKVPLAGEERGRLFNWTAHPMWSKDWVRIIHEEIPLRWTGYKYFIQFLKLIDKRLLNTPIFNRPDLEMQSEKSIQLYEKKYKKEFGRGFTLRMIISHYLPFLGYLKRKLRNKKDKPQSDNDEVYNEFMQYYNKLEKLNSIFDIDNVRIHIRKFGGKYNRLTTLAIYFGEIEKRYLNKIKI